MSLNTGYKSVRCPLYGFIDLTETETHVLDAPAMQRLARIKQLSHTYLVFPSAVHTRLEHSVGTLHVAARICNVLELPLRQVQVIRLAALLHDIGQGPFSHIWEEPMRWVNGDKFSHEEVSKMLIESEPEIVNALGSFQKDVLKTLDNNSIGGDIISSNLDADKLDYLRRDSYHTGVAYGSFDIERVIHTIDKISEKDRDYLAIREKGQEALESYRLARYAMHIQVYEHHTRLIADNMFLKAIKIAISEGDISENNLKTSSNDFIQNFLQLDDFSIQHLILRGKVGKAKDLIIRLRSRNLLKRALELPLNEEGIPDAIKRKEIMQLEKKELENIENNIAEKLHIDPSLVIVHLQSVKIKLYERFWEMLGKKQKPIYIKKKNGIIAQFEEESPFTASLNQINRLYLFCPEKLVKKASAVALSELGLESCVSIPE